MGRGLVVLLLISLGANVFLGGFVAGRMLGKPPQERHERHGPRQPGMMFFEDLEALSPEARDSFKAVFKESRGELRMKFREMRRLRDEFSEALAAEPWDRTRVEAALSELRTVENAHQTELAELLIDAFEGLSPEDRKAMIDAQTVRMEARRERFKSHRGKRGERDGPDMPPPPEE